MSYKASRTLYTICLWVAIVLITGALVLEMRWLAAIGLVLLIAGATQSTFFYKCPHCGTALSLKDRPTKCPQCGEPL